MNKHNDGSQNNAPTEPNAKGDAEHESYLRFCASVGADRADDPYLEDLEPRPYPPTGAQQVDASLPTDTSEGAYVAPDGAQVVGRCRWDAASLTVTFRVTPPAPGTFAWIGIGLVDQPKSGRWHALAVPTQDEQTRTIELASLGFALGEQKWWWRIAIENGIPAEEGY